MQNNTIISISKGDWAQGFKELEKVTMLEEIELGCFVYDDRKDCWNGPH